MKHIVIALLGVSLPAGATAADWVTVASCGDPGQVKAYSYDLASIDRSGDERSVKIRGDYSADRTSRAREAQMLWSFDCANRKFTEASREEYDSGRKVMQSYKEGTGAMALMPGSVADKVFAIVCA